MSGTISQTESHLYTSTLVLRHQGLKFGSGSMAPPWPTRTGRSVNPTMARAMRIARSWTWTLALHGISRLFPRTKTVWEIMRALSSKFHVETLGMTWHDSELRNLNFEENIVHQEVREDHIAVASQPRCRVPNLCAEFTVEHAEVGLRFSAALCDPAAWLDMTRTRLTSGDVSHTKRNLATYLPFHCFLAWKMITIITNTIDYTIVYSFTIIYHHYHRHPKQKSLERTAAGWVAAPSCTTEGEALEASCRRWSMMRTFWSNWPFEIYEP